MTVSRLLGALAGGAARRPWRTVLVALALGAAGAAGALTLAPSAATDTFVGRSSSSYRATQSYYRHFGGEPIDVLVKGSLQRLMLSSDLRRMAGLEGCLAGRVSAKALQYVGGAGGPCGVLARLRAVKVVIGPGTFVNEAARDIDGLLEAHRAAAEGEAKRAQRLVRARAIERGLSAAEAKALGASARSADLKSFAAEVAALAVRYGITGLPSIENRQFVSTLVFEPSAQTPGTPKRRFAYLFPSREAALISVRLKAGLSTARTEEALQAIRAALAMPRWRLQHGRYLLTGQPAIVSQLAGAITSSILLLLVAVAVVMALVLSLVFSAAPRLLPLAVALLAAALTFGVLAATGSGMSIGEVAVLPVLVGLAVDYAIQLHSRVQEAMAGGGGGGGAGGRPATGVGEGDAADGASGPRSMSVGEAVVHAARSGGPSIAAAAAASAGAMLVLELSPVPTVRAFALLLVVGLAIALLCAITFGSAAIVLALRGGGGGPRAPRPSPAASALAPLRTQLSAAFEGARALLRENALTRLISRAALSGAASRPRAVLAIALALAAAGWALSGQLAVQTDITRLVPQEMSSLRSLHTLEQVSGVGGEIDLMVSGKDVASPQSIEWMRGYQRRVLHRFGYTGSTRCGTARLCPAFSLPSLFRPGKLTRTQVDGLLEAIPSYFSQDVISPHRHFASLAFGVRLMPLERQQRMIEAMRAQLHPPAGLHASLVGLPVLAAAAAVQVASPSWRLIDLLAGLAAVALVLLVAFRGSWRRALTPLAPVALATGWSSLVVFCLGVQLNPMSVTLGALVIAISTEFSVLLSERYRQERRARWEPEQALRRAWAGTGAAVAASGVTAIAGFGVLVLSNIAMLRALGLVTVIDLAVSLIGVMVVLPGMLLLSEGSGASAPRTRPALRRRRGLARST